VPKVAEPDADPIDQDQDMVRFGAAQKHEGGFTQAAIVCDTEAGDAPEHLLNRRRPPAIDLLAGNDCDRGQGFIGRTSGASRRDNNGV